MNNNTSSVLADGTPDPPLCLIVPAEETMALPIAGDICSNSDTCLAVSFDRLGGGDNVLYVWFLHDEIGGYRGFGAGIHRFGRSGGGDDRWSSVSIDRRSVEEVEKTKLGDRRGNYGSKRSTIRSKVEMSKEIIDTA
ncbi:hypothetical protein HID58_069965 [Brassica napus]|uniref:Uncharacterized protein n=1 Tax=Brassica napus TaxID=3708 RepID=A0ABQ7YXD8_BRANA|nr:hypothetical protein HID58_069965 [Brassica napus]